VTTVRFFFRNSWEEVSCPITPEYCTGLTFSENVIKIKESKKDLPDMLLGLQSQSLKNAAVERLQVGQRSVTFLEWSFKVLLAFEILYLIAELSNTKTIIYIGQKPAKIVQILARRRDTIF
jgi:hypothetical protein